MLGRRPGLREQPQRLLDQWQPSVCGVDHPCVGGKAVDIGCRRGIRMASKPIASFVREFAAGHPVATCEQRVDGPPIQARQAGPGNVGGGRLCQVQLDSPPPVCRRLRVAEPSLGDFGGRHPGSQFLSVAADSLPVPGYLCRHRCVPDRGERPRNTLVQSRPLSRQQSGCRRLSQKRVPRPVRITRSVISQQAGSRQFAEPLTQCREFQRRDVAEQFLGQRPTRNRQGCQHSMRILAAPARPRRQQPGQPGRQRDGYLQLSSITAGERGGHQLLSEEWIALRSREELIHCPGRHRPACQGGHLARHLLLGQRAQGNLLGRRHATHLRQPVGHVLGERRFVATARHDDCHRVGAPRAAQEGQAI